MSAGLLLAPTPAEAQRASRLFVSQPPASTSPGWLAPVLSAVAPGTGQLVRGDDRGAIYLIAEAYLLQRFASLWTEARREEERYLDVAFEVARAPFAPSVRDTAFEYFEQMGKFVESGPFDADPGPRFDPPTDEETYNGSIWALARRTYFANPDVSPDTGTVEYRQAIAFYQRRAVGPSFSWSWRTSPLEQDYFRQTIRRGDDTFRRASQQLGLLLANHLLSTVDAFVSGRLHRATPSRVTRHWWVGTADRGKRLRLGLTLAF